MTRTGWIALIAALLVAAGAGWVLRGSVTPTGDPAVHAQADDVAYYTCPMHPSVKASEPGSCPICGMDLTPVPKAGTQDTGADAIAHYTCPMHPSVKASEPGACPICGMDLVPVPKAGGQDSGTQGADASGLPGFIRLTSAQQQMIGVKTGTVQVLPASGEVRTVGRVTYDEAKVSDVNLKVSGWIRDLYVDYEGKPVRKGDRLFTLYSPELVSSQEEYLLASRGLARMTAGQDAGAAEDEAAREEALAWNRRLLESARERLSLWDFTDAQIDALERTGKRQTAVTVYAPASGIVTERMAVSGMFVKPEMRLYRIAQLDSVWVIADVYEHELPMVREGQLATVTLSYLQDQTFEGHVDYIYPYLDPKTRTARVRIRLRNDGMRLRPDMYADVRLLGDREDLLIVPESAVLFSGRRRLVFLALGDGRFQPKEVHIGVRYPAGYQVLHGLSAGDLVVTSANFLLDSESKLKNVMAEMGGGGGGGHQH